MEFSSERDRGITDGAVDTGAAGITAEGSMIATMIAGSMDADMIAASKDVDTPAAGMKDMDTPAADMKDMVQSAASMVVAGLLVAVVATMAADRTADAGNAGF